MHVEGAPLHDEPEAYQAEPSDAGLTMARDSGGRRRTLLIVASSDSISPTLASAIQLEFPSIVVEQVGSVGMVCRSFARPVALILLEAFMLGEFESAAAEVTRLHPAARVAIIEADGQRPLNSLAYMRRLASVRGVLPMNVPLDVWLSILRLLLRGGEYYPADLIYPHTGPDPSRTTLVPPRKDRAELTQRELEVLELVSRGLQNKSIAAHLKLSEHTVKIHLHNIISKLRAHNRTEAAAWYREFG